MIDSNKMYRTHNVFLCFKCTHLNIVTEPTGHLNIVAKKIIYKKTPAQLMIIYKSTLFKMILNTHK